jgi:DNA modification methylase
MRTLTRELADNVIPFEKPAHFSIECIDNLQYMRSLGDESMHLIITSPPYNLGKPYEKKTSNCSEAAKLDRFWVEFSAVIPRLGGADIDEGFAVFGRPEGVYSQARC